MNGAPSRKSAMTNYRLWHQWSKCRKIGQLTEIECIRLPVVAIAATAVAADKEVVSFSYLLFFDVGISMLVRNFKQHCRLLKVIFC